jgi:hypothetical protein
LAWPAAIPKAPEAADITAIASIFSFLKSAKQALAITSKALFNRESPAKIAIASPKRL